MRQIWQDAGRGLRAVLIVAVVAACVSVAVLGLALADSGPGVIGVAIAAAAATILLLAGVGWLALPRGVVSRDELWVAAGWGGLVATFLASLLGGFGPGVVVAPFVEEVLKLAGVVVVLRCFRGRFSAIRGFAVGFVVGAGFEAYENVLYVVMPDVPPELGLETTGAVQTAVLRLVLGFGLHAFTTAITGAAVAYVLARTGQVIGRVSMAALAGAIVMHLVWDVAPTVGGVGFGLMVLDYVVLVGAFVGVRKWAIEVSSVLDGETARLPVQR